MPSEYWYLNVNAILLSDTKMSGIQMNLNYNCLVFRSPLYPLFMNAQKHIVFALPLPQMG